MIDNLLNPKISFFRYCIIISILSFGSSLIITQIAETIIKFYRLNTINFSIPNHDLSLLNIIGSIIFAPLVETLLLIFILTILLSFVSNKFHAAIISGILWGFGHAIYGAIWFFGPACGFFFMSCAYMAWRTKGRTRAFFAALIPHVLNNIFGVLISFQY